MPLKRSPVNSEQVLLGGTVKATLDPILGLIPTKDSVNGLKRFPEGLAPDSQIS
jgi:hypothetical protein